MPNPIMYPREFPPEIPPIRRPKAATSSTRGGRRASAPAAAAARPSSATATAPASVPAALHTQPRSRPTSAAPDASHPATQPSHPLRNHPRAGACVAQSFGSRPRAARRRLIRRTRKTDSVVCRSICSVSEWCTCAATSASHRDPGLHGGGGGRNAALPSATGGGDEKEQRAPSAAGATRQRCGALTTQTLTSPRTLSQARAGQVRVCVDLPCTDVDTWLG